MNRDNMRESVITEKQLEMLGTQIADKADNFISFANLPVLPEQKVDALLAGLKEIKKIARELYIEISGDDPWEFE